MFYALPRQLIQPSSTTAFGAVAWISGPQQLGLTSDQDHPSRPDQQHGLLFPPQPPPLPPRHLHVLCFKHRTETLSVVFTLRVIRAHQYFSSLPPAAERWRQTKFLHVNCLLGKFLINHWTVCNEPVRKESVDVHLQLINFGSMIHGGRHSRLPKTHTLLEWHQLYGYWSESELMHLIKCSQSLWIFTLSYLKSTLLTIYLVNHWMTLWNLKEISIRSTAVV